MLVLHGFWSASNGLCLWAEDSTLTVTSPSDALRTARPHPFAAAADAIAPIHAGKPGTAVLLLPSLRKSPLDSPELFRVTPRPAPRIEPVLLPWTIPVMSLPAASALTALDEPAADVRYGASVAYLADLAAFARESGGARPGPARALLRRTRASRVLASGGAGSRHRGPELADRRDATGMPGRAGCPGRPRAGHLGAVCLRGRGGANERCRPGSTCCRLGVAAARNTFRPRKPG